LHLCRSIELLQQATSKQVFVLKRQSSVKITNDDKLASSFDTQREATNQWQTCDYFEATVQCQNHQ